MRFVGKVNSKHGAAARILADDDLAALRGDETAEDGEADPEAAGARGIAPLEFLKEPLAHFHGETRAAVGDSKEDARASGLGAGGKKNRRGGRRVKRSVEKKIRDDLLHECGVSAEERKVGGH